MKNLKKYFIFVILILIFPTLVNADITVSIAGKPSGGNGSSTSGSIVGSWELAKGVGLSINLVKVSDSSIDVVTKYYIIWKGSPTRNEATPFYNTFIASKSNPANFGYNSVGGGYVCGSLTSGSSYDGDGCHYASSVAENMWFGTDGTGYTIDSSKIISQVFNLSTKEFGDAFYRMITKLFEEAGGSLPTELRDYTSQEKFRELIKNYKKDSKYADAVNVLKDYRVLIEPIYMFTKKGNNSERKFVTIKSIAIDKAKSQRTYGGLPYNDNDMVYNLHACSGKIDSPFTCEPDTIYGMASSLNGYGYGLISIVEEVKTCDPKTMCCFDEWGTYHKDYKGKDENHSECSDKNKSYKDGDKCEATLTSCKKETPKDCEDGVKTTVCNEDGSSMDAHFYENNNIEKCTLEEGKNSGFMMLDVNFKLDGDSEKHQYCKVACKEDYDIKFPTAKFAASGRYFKLDQYIPEIKATRTCATNKIEYDKFMEDMDNAEKEMVLNYNTAQDGAYLTNGLNPVIEKYGGSSVEPTASFDLTKSAAGVGDQLIPHPDSCPDVDDYGNVTCLCRYIRYEWKHSTIKILHKHTDSRKKFSSSYSYAEDIPAASNSYNVGSCECACRPELVTYDVMISDIRSHYEGDRGIALGYVSSGDGGHADYKNKYKEAQDDFKMCTSLDTPISWLASKEDYTYKFEPTVTFKYNEKGNNNYPTEYKYSYDKNNGDVEIVQKDTALEGGEKLYFWSYTHAAGGEYDDPDSTNQYDCPSMYSLLDCTYVSGADTCNYGSKYKSSNCQKADMDGRNRPNGGVNFANDKNIKRVETVDYKYHLPVYQTYIPNGKVDELYKYNERAKLPSSSALKLEEEAAPVNINTVQGKYNYSIEVKDIVNKDDIRYKIRTDNSLKRNKPEPESPGFVKNYIDDLEKRFYSTEKDKGALNDGENEQYKCNYTVINEIYDPEKERVKFFYKPIDLTQDNPLDRIRGYNWNPTYNDVVNDLETRMKETGSDMQILKSADKFEFVLTPNVMKAIRKYNKGISEGYSDWNMLCTKREDNGKDYYCESYFLTCLTTGVCDSIKVTGNTEGLYDSFKEVNQNSEFNRTELRSKLLQIQNGKVGG